MLEVLCLDTLFVRGISLMLRTWMKVCVLILSGVTPEVARAVCGLLRLIVECLQCSTFPKNKLMLN